MPLSRWHALFVRTASGLDCVSLEQLHKAQFSPIYRHTHNMRPIIRRTRFPSKQPQPQHINNSIRIMHVAHSISFHKAKTAASPIILGNMQLSSIFFSLSRIGWNRWYNKHKPQTMHVYVSYVYYSIVLCDTKMMLKRERAAFVCRCVTARHATKI